MVSCKRDAEDVASFEIYHRSADNDLSKNHVHRIVEKKTIDTLGCLGGYIDIICTTSD